MADINIDKTSNIHFMRRPDLDEQIVAYLNDNWDTTIMPKPSMYDEETGGRKTAKKLPSLSVSLALPTTLPVDFGNDTDHYTRGYTITGKVKTRDSAHKFKKHITDLLKTMPVYGGFLTIDSPYSYPKNKIFNIIFTGKTISIY